jgi:hypothetical protein
LVTALLGLISTLLGIFVTDSLARNREDRNKREAEDKATQLKKEAEDKATQLNKEIERADRLAFYREMKHHLISTRDAFDNQIAARDRLYELLKSQYGPFPEGKSEYEHVFREYHSMFNEEEKYLCKRLKTNTEILYYHNNDMFEIRKKYPEYYDELDAGMVLYIHLDYWLKKYKQWMPQGDTCLIYVGVEEHKPFPNGTVIHEDGTVTHENINKDIEQKISEYEGKTSQANTRP